MVCNTRSAEKNTNEVVGNSLKKKVVNGKQPSNLTPGKADILGLRKSARGTQSSKLKTPSPQNMRKSERIEKQAALSAPTTPPVKRKSDRIEKHNLTSSLRTSDRGKKITSSKSSGYKRSGKRLGLLNVKKKEIKEKSLKQLTVESGEAEPDTNYVGKKRKKMDAHSSKALFKPQKINYSMPDVAEELPRQDKKPQVDDREISSEPLGKSDESSGRVMEKLADESAGTASGVNVLESDIEGKLLQYSSLRTANGEPSQPPGGDGLKNLRISCTIIDILDDAERAPTNCSSFENLEVIDGLENDVQRIQPKGSVPLLSSGREVHGPLGACIICFRKTRLDYDSPEDELCSCGATSNMYLNDFSKYKDRGDQEAAIYTESAGRCCSDEHLNEIHSDYRMGGPNNVCVICNQGGELLCCIGNGCKRCYHLSCLDPPLSDVPAGVWHCLWCVKKKVELGAHSVSLGVESIWNAREVEISNAEGVRRQKQYLAKYHGLAHIHNHWLPEKQLLPQNLLLAEFNSKHQVVRWNAEWTVPHRLLKKRLIIFSRLQNKHQIMPSIDSSDCLCEWLVKWCGLGYEHASWELDNSYTLRSPRGQNLVKDYEIRLQKAKRTVDESRKGSYIKLSKLPAGGSLPKNQNLLKHVNKLRWYWYNSQNTVVFDNQEWAMTVIAFVLSLTEVCQPFLIIVASDAISQWEAEFTRLSPSIAVTIYSGSRDTRKTIRTLEFFEEGDCMMLQVLLSSPEAVFEDLDILRCIKWEAVIVHECQHSGIENPWEQIKILPTNSRILLFNGQIKDTVSEYLNLLSLLDSCDDLGGFRSDTIDNLGKLKERLARFIAYGSIPELSQFVEYWVPVPMSNCQLEQYCAALLTNSIPLCSCSKSDPVGAFRDILFTVRKCCDHPYLVNSSLQESLIAEGCLATELLDTGIKACGKLQLLDMILSEIKNQGQQVVILCQTVVGVGRASIGDILDDFLRQRFGPNFYERIDARVVPSKKHAAVNRFNKKENGQFVFLLENRACSSSIKLSSVNIVIVYDSEWNPANDLRALQKISFNSKLEQIKVFRLYSSCTVEEKALLLATQVLNLDNNLHNLSRTTSDTLLMWGASYLFSKLDDYYADRSPTSALNISSEQLLLNDTTKELLTILSETSEYNGSGCIISKVQLDVGRYSINLPLLGEGKFQLKDGEEAHVFWRKLLEGRNPQWKYSCGSTPRNRKRVQFFDESSGNPDTGSDEVRKKHRKAVNENVDPASIQVEPKGHQLTQAAGCKGGSSTAVSTTQSQSVDESTSHQTDNVNPESNSNFIFGQSSFDPGVHVDKSQEIVTSSNEQKSLHIIIKGEMARLCQILKVSEDVMHMVERFLEYVIKNHHVSNESPTIIQAFQISLCWIAASILKQKINKKDSLMTAKQFLNYGCTEEQANHVYSKMRLLKKMFLQCSLNTKKSIKDCLLSTEDFSIESCKTDAGIPQFSVVSLLSVKSDIERSANKEHSSGLIVSEHKKPLKNKVAECETEYMLKKIRRKCDKRLKILLRKQQEEVQKFHRIWEEKKERLEKEHKLESACIRFIHGGSVTIDKLKLLDSDFAKKMEEYKCLKDMHVKDLEANQLVARNDERRKAARWLAKAKACHSELKAVDDPVGCSETRAHITLRDPENAVPMSEQHIEDTNPTKAVHLAQENDVAPSNTCVIAQAEAVGCTVPTETANHLVNITSEREVGSSSFESTSIAELPSELTHSSNTTREMASVDLPGCGELVSNEIQMVQASEGIPTGVPDTIPEDAGHVHSVEQSDFSNKKCDIGDRIDTSLSDDVNQIDGDESIDGCPSSLEQSLLPPAETFAPSDHCGSLPPSQVLLESSVYGEFQLGDAPVPENRSTLQVEVAISKHIDSETCALSKDLLSENLSTLQVGVATSERINSEPPAQSNHAPAIENREQLQPVSIDVSLSCDRTPASEVEHENYDRERILIPETSPQSSGEPEALSHQVACQRGQELEQHHPVALVDSTLDRYHLDLGLVSQVNHVPNGEFFASQSFLSAPQAVVNTAELPSQVIWQTEVDLSHARGSGNLTSQPPYQVPSWHPAPSLHAEPLLNELLRISKEREKTVKVYEDLKLLLKSECEKAIEEVIAQIRNKFEAKLHDAEIAFHLKKNELDKNHNNVLMNRILAEAFRSKCLDLKPSSPSRLQQAMSSSFMQQLPMPRPVRHPVSSVCPQTTVPTVQASQQLPLPLSTVPAPIFVSSSSCQPWTMASTGQATHQPLLPHSTGPASGFVSSSGCQPVASQHNPTPAVQTVHRASALCSGAPTRPPHISAITPSTGNLRIGEVRSPAPHLQPFQPSTSASAASLPSHGMPSQQATATRPATSPSFSQHTPQRTPHSQVPSLPQQLPLVPTNSVSHNRPQPESRPSAPHNSSQSAFQLLVDMDHQSPVHGRTTVASLRDVVTNFGSLELSDLETLGNVQGSLTSSVPATDVVYLSDDN